MSPLEVALDDYLRLRRSLGHKLDRSGRELAKFVAYMDSIGAETVTMEAALAFVLDPALDPATTVPGARLTAVRGFARHLAGSDPRTELPPCGLVTDRPRRRTPWLFSDQDVAAVAAAARESTPFPFRAQTLTTLIGLLAVTGMRVGEALRLDRADIDWDQAVIEVRNTKFTKGRDLPVTPSTIEALQAYLQRPDRPSSTSHRLFVSLAGTPVFYTDFHKTFTDAVNAARIGRDTPIRPRIHDLRHSFALRTVVAWYRQGLDVEAVLPRLSTYLGHREPRYTYHYLTAAPELLAAAAVRLEASMAVIP